MNFIGTGSAVLEDVAKALIDHGGMEVEVSVKVKNKRTLPQNSAIHLYCTMLANALNESGYSLSRYVEMLKRERSIEVDWTGDAVKNEIWHRVQLAKFPEAVANGKPSTTALTRVQVSECYEEINRFTGNKMGVSIPFPDRSGE